MSARPLTVIEPPLRWAPLRLSELWACRDLILLLTWRDITVRYRQAVMGVAWAILQPLATMTVFSVFFGRLGRIPSDGLPYPLFTLTALVPWTFFSNALTQTSSSVVASQHLITKVYFPRLALPLGTVLSGLVDFALAFVLLTGLMLWYGYLPSSRILWIVPLMAIAFSTALGVGLWLAAANVRYRDVRHAVPFLSQLWLFMTPVAYPSSLLDAPWRTVYALNPMVGVVDGFRWALLGGGSGPDGFVLVSALAAALLLTSGSFYFRRMEASFVDTV